MSAVAAVVGAGAISGLLGLESGRKQASAAKRGVSESRRQFDLIFKETEAARGASKAAFLRLKDFLGLGDPDFDAQAELEKTPGFQFRFGQGQKAVQNIQSVPGGGSRFGGRALKELTRFGQNFGSNEFGNTINQLAWVVSYDVATSTSA